MSARDTAKALWRLRILGLEFDDIAQSLIQTRQPHPQNLEWTGERVRELLLEEFGELPAVLADRKQL
ncbi:hypothetical protein HNR42_000351 [Deinobacterium chartae]|uniref:Uncharacterized protein n=1 Tax=Deinobacterium chartae TaxID=521158 RepID=A0A841HXH0_9DEIO|nr:hypothetical protein [Deinobacterium chartae]MBB6096939.1 hypothetical protein [Deinobacterium chartae]